MNKIIIPLLLIFTTIAFSQIQNPFELNHRNANKIQLKIKNKVVFNNENLDFESLLKKGKNVDFKYSSSNVCGQILVGSLSAIVFSAPAAFGFSYGGGNHPSDGGKLFLTYSLYTLGAAVGVYWIGSKENKSLSFWGTFASSAIGGGVGALTYYQIKNRFYFPILAGPIVGALIYSLFIAD